MSRHLKTAIFQAYSTCSTGYISYVTAKRRKPLFMKSIDSELSDLTESILVYFPSDLSGLCSYIFLLDL